MSDLESLKQRIAAAELRLKTAHAARQRESAALVAMWDQIRDRFAAQNAEIARLHTRIDELEETRRQLRDMVLTLLGAVESGIERIADETVPRITGLAEALLEAEPSMKAEFPAPGPSDSPADTPAAEDAGADFMSVLADRLAADEAVPALPPYPADEEPARGADGPASPGIRALIARIEQTFEGRDAPAAPPAAAEADRDTDLARDLDDIRRLREELRGLRERIGTGGR